MPVCFQETLLNSFHWEQVQYKITIVLLNVFVCMFKTQSEIGDSGLT